MHIYHKSSEELRLHNRECMIRDNIRGLEEGWKEPDGDLEGTIQTLKEHLELIEKRIIRARAKRIDRQLKKTLIEITYDLETLLAINNQFGFNRAKNPVKQTISLLEDYLKLYEDTERLPCPECHTTTTHFRAREKVTGEIMAVFCSVCGHYTV